MHLKRWITGLSALPFLIFLVYKGGVFFASLVSAASLVALWEYYRITVPGKAKSPSGIILWWGYGFCCAITWAAYGVGADLILGLVALNLVTIAVISMFQFKTDRSVLNVIINQLQGIIYIPVSLGFLILIREGHSGTIWIFLLLAIIFAGDTSAYYVGSYLGKHKLSPAISPGKWSLSILFFLAVGIAGQLGDLFESEMKRSSNIKDSSNILPGHGGILDRIDALLFASPVAYVFIRFVF
jgi:phosphatidate cytidylyltransferase